MLKAAGKGQSRVYSGNAALNSVSRDAWHGASTLKFFIH